jgi:NAD(P)-dependent dehydrogenase (short-subunit alcohol dehydrogenase family)
VYEETSDRAVALITGGASGIGRACAETLASEGWAVAVADLNHDAAEEVAGGIGAQAMAVRLDVRDEQSVAACVSTVRSELGRIDALVNSAALTDSAHHAQDLGPAAMELSVWRATFATDLEGVMLMCRAVIPIMVEAGGGAIVNISSNAAAGGDMVRSAYAAAKAGVNSLTRSVAVAHGRSGVRCNAVSPGGILGPSFERNLSAETKRIMADQRLLPYPGYPEDVAKLVAFLASDRARYLTGQIISIDGGASSQSSHVPASRTATEVGDVDTTVGQ